MIFGLLFQTFGIGHVYAGNVGTGLFLMFGWWFFVFLNLAVLPTITCGRWWFLAVMVVPAFWFLLMIASPLMAASSVR